MSRLRYAFVLLVAGLFAALSLGPSAAHAEVLPMDVAELAARADAIVVVKVGPSQARKGRGSGVESFPIVTDTALHITRVLKGERPDEIVLTQPGGTLDGTTVGVSEIPEFVPGERCVLFLNSAGGVVGGYQGKLAVKGNSLPDVGLDLSDLAVPPEPDPVPQASVPAFELILAAVDEQTGQAALIGTPVIASMTPSGRNAGVLETVTIEGSGFGATRGSGKVEFTHGLYMNGTKLVATSISSWSDTSIVAVIPRRAASGPVVVTNSDGTASAPFNYTVGFSTGGARVSVSSAFRYRVNENTADVTGEAAAIQAAMDTWNGVGTPFRLAYAGASAATVNPPNTSNGSSDIYFSSTGFTDSGILGWNSWRYSGSNLIESDIVFNDAYTWSTAAVSGRFDIESVALHELGHTVGLDDQYPNTNKVMGAAISGRTRRTLSNAELDGIRYLYGASADVAAPSMPSVSSSTHPDDLTWYANSSATFSFSATDDRGVAGYSYVIDGAANTVPDTISDGTSTVKTFTNLSDGVRWFHVRARDAAGNWGPAAHYRFRVDRTAPATSDDVVADYTLSAAITLSGDDAGSGVARTDWLLDGVAGSGTSVNVVTLGQHTLAYWSTDEAGNREATVNRTFTVHDVPRPDPVSDGAGKRVEPGTSVLVTATAPAAEGFAPADGVTLFDEVTGAGDFVLARGPVTPVTGWRPLGLTWHPSFTGSTAGDVQVSVPLEPLLTTDRLAALRVLYFDGAGWSTAVPSIDPQTRTLTVRLDALAPFVVVEPAGVDTSSRFSIASSSVLSPSYGARAKIVVTLASASGSRLADRGVTLHAGNGSFIATLTPSATSPGTYSGYAPLVRSRTNFSARFGGDVANSASSKSITVLPKAGLTIDAPSRATRGRTFSVSGTLRPYHGRGVVRAEAWKKTSSGSYKRVKSVWVTTTSIGFRARFALPAGSYRFRLVHSDYAHATSTSRWDYTRVR